MAISLYEKTDAGNKKIGSHWTFSGSHGWRDLQTLAFVLNKYLSFCHLSWKLQLASNNFPCTTFGTMWHKELMELLLNCFYDFKRSIWKLYLWMNIRMIYLVAWKLTATEIRAVVWIGDQTPGKTRIVGSLQDIWISEYLNDISGCLKIDSKWQGSDMF